MSRANLGEGKSYAKPKHHAQKSRCETRHRPPPARASTLRARELCQTQTPYEAKLWKLLRNRQLENYKFRRQVPIGPYFADFACLQEKLGIELDGSSHADRAEYDAMRDTTMVSDGWRVLRVANRDLMNHEESVLLTICAALDKKESSQKL